MPQHKEEVANVAVSVHESIDGKRDIPLILDLKESAKFKTHTFNNLIFIHR